MISGMASKDNPRTLRREKPGEDPEVVRCVDPGEFLSLTSAFGYRDVTDEASGSSRRSSSRSGSASSGKDEPNTSSS